MSQRPEGSKAAAAAQLELFTQRFAALAREMGEQLRRTAMSTNVKERLDFSCALLDPQGRLVVNAPHIPVHLGALGLCVRAVVAELAMEPGDVVVTNHPAFGGSHLPDVTVITPVFATEEEQDCELEAHSSPRGSLLGYVASRAHHAEIGGARPGSMPPSASCLAEEGVVLSPTYLLRRGTPRWDQIRRRLMSGPYPSRSLEENLADLAAAVAANHRGAAALRQLAEDHGAPVVLAQMKGLRQLAKDALSQALTTLPQGPWKALTRLDDGTPLKVAIHRQGSGLRVDFSGSGPVHRGNLNAPPAVTTSAVLYVLRLLLQDSLPLNEGLLESVEMVLPPGLLNPPFDLSPERAPAVVGGNVETSQRVVEVLLMAFGLAAASQGTMNNTLFGNESFGYYETVCGGAGAGPDFAGASGVHTHMTNTRITDPEVLEHRYPVRLERFALRRGSGGEGQHRGGDGVVREIVFLQPMALSLLSQHRRSGPPGAEGGGAGLPGRQVIVPVSGGEPQPLEAIDARDVRAGDRLVLETPGGGGWGSPGSETEIAPARDPERT
ncbi:MAG: hydantoinase B/oxoprolinase family protein [Acidobacteriota bacterium]